MAEIKVIVNGVEYSENQFKKDIVRLFDTYRNKNSEYMGSICCNDVSCDNCPLRFSPCDGTKYNYYGMIKGIFLWAQKHPVITNTDKMIEVFGDDVFHHVVGYHDEWLYEEYKKPKGE